MSFVLIHCAHSSYSNAILFVFVPLLQKMRMSKPKIHVIRMLPFTRCYTDKAVFRGVDAHMQALTHTHLITVRLPVGVYSVPVGGC